MTEEDQQDMIASWFEGMTKLVYTGAEARRFNARTKTRAKMGPLKPSGIFAALCIRHTYGQG